MRRRQKRSIPKLIIFITVPLIALSATFILLYFLSPHRPEPIVPLIDTPRTTRSATPPAVISSPVQLKIDTIKVASTVTPVGLTPEGDMDIDEDPGQVAWYQLGPKPGEEGSAVMAGHYGWKNGVASVFNDLHTLVKGDRITTIGEDGNELTFVVTRTAVYAPEQDATYVFKSDDGKAHLNLVTCQGTWNNTLDTYSERLVVFTNLAE